MFAALTTQLVAAPLLVKWIMTTSRVVVYHRAYEELRKSFLEGEELAKAGWMRVGGWMVCVAWWLGIGEGGD